MLFSVSPKSSGRTDKKPLLPVNPKPIIVNQASHGIPFNGAAGGSICPGMDGIRAMQEQLPREARLLVRGSESSALIGIGVIAYCLGEVFSRGTCGQ